MGRAKPHSAVMGNCSCANGAIVDDAELCANTASNTTEAPALRRGKSFQTGELLEMLMKVEADQKAQDALFDELKSQGACMIVTVELEEPDPDQMLIVLRYVRALFAMRIWNDQVRLVKSDANRFFIFATNAGIAFKAALSMKFLVSTLDSWIGKVCPEHGPLRSPATMKAGIHHGGILLIEGDCFGDPVNVASKLGEDIAKADEILVSQSSVQNDDDKDMKEMQSCCKMTQKSTEISGLTLDYSSMEAHNMNMVHVLVPAVSSPEKEEVTEYLNKEGSGEMIKKEVVILTTDMSGFTRLTKRYGILHFLRLVLQARRILLPAMADVGGWLVKYEGDNIIAAFPNVDVAVSSIRKCMGQIAEYNKTREKDYQVRMGFGIDFGEVHFLGHDIVGSTFENSFTLAEDIAEVGELLLTERVKSVGWPSTQDATKLSEQRTLEGSGTKYYALSFV